MGSEMCIRDSCGVLSQSAMTVSSARKGWYYLANAHERDSTPTTTRLNITYHVNCRQTKRLWASLIDRGANGGIAGTDTRVIDVTNRTIDLSGIDDHTVRNLPIITAGGVVRSNKGDIILVLNEYAHMPDGKSIPVSYTHLTLPTICSV